MDINYYIEILTFILFLVELLSINALTFFVNFQYKYIIVNIN